MKKPAKRFPTKLAQIERYIEHLKRLYFIRKGGKDMIDELYKIVYERIK